MNVNRYLTEMRAAGYTFEVVQHPGTDKQGLRIMHNLKPGSAKSRAHILELETWRNANVTTKQLAEAVSASKFTKPKLKEPKL